MNNFRLKYNEKYNYYKIVEIVGTIKDDIPLTIEWTFIYKTKQEAIKDLEKTLKISLSETEYKNLVYNQSYNVKE